MYRLSLFLVIILFFSCKEETIILPLPTISIDNPKDLVVIQDSTDFREFRVLDSRYLSKEEIWKNLNDDLEDFTQETHDELKPLIFEQDIPTIQGHIANGDLSYELLTKFYLYRIRKFDRENELSLNSVISINPYIVEEARIADKTRFVSPPHQIFGMPILLKDNINAAKMPTTAGAVVLHNNYAEDAYITKQLKKHGALILGKTNLSEWAYFFCGDCPSGYSAVGGQTLNPYGRRIIDTGGSSSGSGVSVAANFCVAAVGSETSGSILSPSSANSIVGLKPTIGLLSRNGIVPISSTLDTPGPMTKNVIDNAIMLEAMSGYDIEDPKSEIAKNQETISYSVINPEALKGKRFGVFERLMERDSTYVHAIEELKKIGVEIIEVNEMEVDFSGFLNLLNLDMRKDLPVYLSKSADTSTVVTSVSDIIEFNNLDSLNRAPYGQKLFKGIVADEGNQHTLDSIITVMRSSARMYFNRPYDSHSLDGFLSVNNWHAGFAALAEYPALTVPMGYTTKGVPRGLTFIAKPLEEKLLLEWGYLYEQATKKRVTPKDYN